MIAFFIGTDEYLKTEGAKRVIDRLLPPDARDFGLDVVDGACDRADDVVEAVARVTDGLRTPSFLGGNKVVWLREANFLPGAKGRAAEAQAAKEAVAAFTEGLMAHPLPEGHTLIVSATALPRTSKFAKWAEKNAEIVDCGGEVRSYQMEKVAAERLEAVLPESGLTMAPAVRAAFAQRVGADTRTIVSELAKLRAYVGGAAEATLQDVEAITSSSVGTEPFALAEAIQARSPAKIVKTIALLRQDRNAAFPAAAIVLNTLNDLCALRDALDQGWIADGRWDLPRERIPARLARLSGWALAKPVEAAKRYTLNELRAGRHYAVEMRFRLVDATLQDPWDIIEQTLLRVTLRQGGRR